MCVIIPFILDVRLVDVPAGVTQEEGHTGLLHLLSAVLALIFIARRIQPFLSLVDREVEFCALTKLLIVLHFLDIFILFIYLFIVRENPSSEKLRPNVRRFRDYQPNHRDDRLSRY